MVIVGAGVQVSGDAEALDVLEKQPVGTIVGVPQSATSPLSQSLRRARLLLDRRDVALVEIEVPISRLAAAAWLVEALEAPVGVRPVLMRCATEMLCTVACVDSPTRLRRPAPSLLQHVSGWYPASGWFVDFDEGSVRRLGKGRAPRVRGAMDAVTYASEPAAESWAESLQGAVSGHTDVLATGSVTTPGFWGVRRWAEMTFARISTDELLTAMHRSVTTWTCRLCSQLVAGAACPFCGVGADDVARYEADLHHDSPLDDQKELL